MGLTDVGARATAARAHVLIAETPGAFRQRVALERGLDRIGWCITGAVADADVLAVVGAPGAELRALIDHAWAQLSEPRARIDILEESDIPAAIDAAVASLRSPVGPRLRAGRTPDDGTAARGERDHGSHDHGSHDHGEMSPHGIPLAEGADDRDGLEMDELHLPLGPVLTHWPPGVVLHLTLHGDVAAGAEGEYLAAADDTRGRPDALVRAAQLLDAAASVLSLAGLSRESARARQLRDGCLDGTVDAVRIDSLRMRVRRHRALRWVMNGLVINGDHGRSERLHERLISLFDRAGAAVESDPVANSHEGPTLADIASLVSGHELSTIRLWMAALRADLIRPAGQEPSRG